MPGARVALPLCTCNGMSGIEVRCAATRELEPCALEVPFPYYDCVLCYALGYELSCTDKSLAAAPPVQRDAGMDIRYALAPLLPVVPRACY
eukprot:1055015-Rhodomonas_salina.2